MHFFSQKGSRFNYQLCRSEKAEANHLSERLAKQDEATSKKVFGKTYFKIDLLSCFPNFVSALRNSTYIAPLP